MVLIRRNDELHLPPPNYDPNSDHMTVAFHYGGLFRNGPPTQYIGGHVLKADFVKGKNLKLSDFDKLLESVEGLDDFKSYYIQFLDIFKLLYSDEDLGNNCRRFLGTNEEFKVYARATYINPMSQVGENFDDIVEQVVRAVESSVGNGNESSEDAAYITEEESTDEDLVWLENVDEEVGDTGLGLSSPEVVDAEFCEDNSDDDTYNADREESDDDQVFQEFVDSDVEDTTANIQNDDGVEDCMEYGSYIKIVDLTSLDNVHMSGITDETPPALRS